jgi:hypothetical protein
LPLLWLGIITVVAMRREIRSSSGVGCNAASSDVVYAALLQRLLGQSAQKNYGW